MWHLGTWFRGGLGSATLPKGLKDLKGLFQPFPNYSMALRYLREHTPKGNHQVGLSVFKPCHWWLL